MVPCQVPLPLHLNHCLIVVSLSMQDHLKALTEGIHSREALETVKEHVKTVMGPASMAHSNTILKMSKLQAAQVILQ